MRGIGMHLNPHRAEHQQRILSLLVDPTVREPLPERVYLFVRKAASLAFFQHGGERPLTVREQLPFKSIRTICPIGESLRR